MDVKGLNEYFNEYIDANTNYWNAFKKFCTNKFLMFLIYL